MKVGIIGASDIAGLAHIDSYYKLKDVEVKGVADKNEKTGRRLCNKYRCRYYSDFKQLIDKNELDAVSICTPPYERNDIIRYIVENDINILCESPLADSYQNALKIKKIVERSNIQLMMGFVSRFIDHYQNAEELIRKGKFGEIVFSRYIFASELPYHLFLTEKNPVGGALMDKGSHLIDLATWLFGMPNKIYAIVMNKRDADVEENTFVTLMHENCISQLTLSYGVNIHFNRPMERLEIYGTACNMIIDRSLDIYSFLSASDHILKDYLKEVPRAAIKLYLRYKKFITREDPYFKEIKYFVERLKQGREVTPSCTDGLINIKIIDACYESAEKGIPIEVTYSSA
jgi:predicted dehydrogenase